MSRFLFTPNFISKYEAYDLANFLGPKDELLLTEELIVRKRKTIEASEDLRAAMGRSLTRDAAILRLLAQASRLQLEAEEHLGNYIQGRDVWSREQLVLTGEQQDAVVEQMCVLCFRV